MKEFQFGWRIWKFNEVIKNTKESAGELKFFVVIWPLVQAPDIEIFSMICFVIQIQGPVLSSLQG